MALFRCVLLLACLTFCDAKKKYSVNFDVWELVSVEDDKMTAETVYTYRSIPFILKPGQIVMAAQHPKFPPGNYGVTSFWGKVTDEYSNQVPQSQVYVHHWAVTNQRKNGGYTPTQSFVYSVGSETRHALTTHAPYAYVPHPDDLWTGMVHILDTRHVTSVKECIECICPEEQAKTCCDDHTFCETKPYPPESEKVYYLMYHIRTVPMNEELVPVKTVVLDVADGHVHYNVPQCTAEPCEHARVKNQVVPDELDIVVMVGHLHQGSINMTTTVSNAAGREFFRCTSVPTIGTGALHELGNETNYLVDMSVCRGSPLVRVPAGSLYSVTAYYDSHEMHVGVMGLCVIYAIDYTEWGRVRTILAEQEEHDMEERRK